MYTIESLAEERRGYVLRGLDDRVAQVDAEIARVVDVGLVVEEAEPVIEKATADPVVETAAKPKPRTRK